MHSIHGIDCSTACTIHRTHDMHTLTAGSEGPPRGPITHAVPHVAQHLPVNSEQSEQTTGLLPNTQQTFTGVPLAC
jgi:hypothetical protein